MYVCVCGEKDRQCLLLPRIPSPAPASVLLCFKAFGLRCSYFRTRPFCVLVGSLANPMLLLISLFFPFAVIVLLQTHPHTHTRTYLLFQNKKGVVGKGWSFLL